LTDRLNRLEERVQVGYDQEFDEFLKRLTDDELEWLLGPDREAQSLVPCPHVEMVECGCKSRERARRGYEERPELLDEYLRRRNILVERADEIMERAPWGR
jgi:hypothetical protein